MTRAGLLGFPILMRLAAASLLLLAFSSFEFAKGAHPTVAAPPSDARRIPLPRQTSDMIAADEAIKTVLNVDKKLKYGEFVWDEEGVPLGPIWIRVDLRAQLLSVFRSGHEIGTAVILYGAPAKPTPPGRFRILERREHHRSSLYGTAMPFTLRLTDDGIAIHGSDVRFGAATHGCIGLPGPFAKRLFASASVGDDVYIVA